MATVRIYKVAELLGTTSQEVSALLKRDHGIEVKSASSTIEEVVARQFVERLAKQRSIALPTGDIFAETPVVRGRKGAPAKKAPEPPKVAEVLPILYLRGLSTGDFREALPVLLGPDAAGLSPANIARLTNSWEAEYRNFRRRSLKDRDYVYVWADGIHVNIRLEEDPLCLLVLIGVRPDGTKELIAVEDGYRESTESWLSLLRELKARGMKAPVVAVGDGALGFWAAVHQLWPETREQRCWVHRVRVVLDKLPKRLQAKAKEALHEILGAATRDDAEQGIAAFVAEYGAKYPKAVDSLTRDQDELLTFFDFPAQHWKSLRTTNVVESPFATVRLRQRVTKGNGSRTKGLTMAYKLLDMAEHRWRRLDGAARAAARPCRGRLQGWSADRED